MLILQLFSLVLFAQTRIPGKVTAANGGGLSGISFQLRNTTYGTVTDEGGSYTLDFSGVGFRTVSQAIQLSAGSNTANTSLQEDLLQMDEVVVTGTLDGISKRQLGNSVSTPFIIFFDWLQRFLYSCCQRLC